METFGGIDMVEKIDISIDGTEKTKNEVVYNNVMKNLSKEEQINYLRNKVTNLELEMKNKTVALILIISSLVCFAIGIYFLIADLYILGTVVIFATFIASMVRFYMMYKSILNVNHNMEFDKLEHLRKMLNMRLK